MKHRFKFIVTLTAEDPRTAAIVRDEIAQSVQCYQDSTEEPCRISVGDISRPDKRRNKRIK